MKHIFLLLFATILLSACASKPQEEGTTDNETTNTEQIVNVYSHRHYPSDVQLFEQFTAQTGIKVNVIKASADQLMKRIEEEGEKSPADILLTVDAGRLYRAKQKGILQSFNSEIINETVPTAFRDPENQWVGLTIRARLIAYAKGKVDPATLSSMDALTQPEWNGKVLVRQSNNIYNQSLLASIIHNEGEEKAKEWAMGIVKNMARDPKGNDRDQMKELVKGTGDVAIVNSYYIGLLLNSDNPDEQAVGEKIGVFFPNQEGKGTHINISGAGLTKYAPNKENAIKFMEFLVSTEAQQVFASVNYEYPVNPAVQPSELLQSWGTFKADSTDFNKLGELNTRAVEIFDEAGWK